MNIKTMEQIICLGNMTMEEKAFIMNSINAKEQPLEYVFNTEKYVSYLLRLIGCTIGFKGFNYIKLIIIHAVDNQNGTLKPILEEYQSVLDHYCNQKVKNVKSAINAIINQVWDNQNKQYCIEILSDYIRNPEISKPTNKEFLSVLTKKVYDSKKKFQVNLEMLLKQNTASERRKTHSNIKLKDLINSVELKNLQILHIESKIDSKYVAELNKDTFTRDGYEEWGDVLNADIVHMSQGYYGFVIECVGAQPERFQLFRNMLAGHCSQKDYKKWINVRAQEENISL